MHNKIKKTILILLFVTLSTTLTYSFDSKKLTIGPSSYLEKTKTHIAKYGAPAAGSNSELELAKLIEKEFNKLELATTIQKFNRKTPKTKLESQNVIAEINKGHKKTLIIGAHYDAVKIKNSYGAIDNLASIALLLSIAEHAKKSKKLKYNLVFIAFGSEEIGLLGSKHYVNKLSSEDIENIHGMINLDTTVGGDILYIHSAHTTPYNCTSINTVNYSHKADLRNAILDKSISILKSEQYSLHQDYNGFPKGVTGGWSDHSSFACVGVPIAYIEATNFKIIGKDGNDGYSQTTNSKFWDCFDTHKMSSCNKQKETRWGNIWHSEYDTFEAIDDIFPHRIQKQLDRHYQVLTSFIEDNK